MSAHGFDSALRAVVADELRALVEQLPDMIGDAVRRVLAERETDALIDTAELARLVGAPSARAMRARLNRGSPLAELAITDDTGRRRWRRSSVLALLARR